MPAIAIFTGLACGMLLSAVGLVLWDGFRQMTGLSQAVQVVGWLAGGLLLIGALLAWWGGRSLSAPALRLTLMAALAAPPRICRRPRSSWGSLMLILPAPVLAGAALFWASEPVVTGADSLPVALAELAVIICGGLGARALGEGLREIVASTPQVEWPSAAAHALLTLLVGGTALVNLWQRGAVWGGTTGEVRLAGAWLTWSAARLGPRQPPRLRAVLIAVVAAILILASSSRGVGS